MRVSPTLALRILGVAATSTAGTAFGQQVQFQAQVTNNLNLRAGPSITSGVLKVLPSGGRVDVLGCSADGSWCEVRFEGDGGWASARYLERLQPAQDGAQDAIAEGAPAANEVCFYSAVDFGGEALCELIGASATSALPAQANTAAASVRVGGEAELEVCELPDFRGWCEVHVVDITNLADSPNIASYRITPRTIALACFFDEWDFEGPGFCVRPDLSEGQIRGGWDDRISSIQISGTEIQICQGANFAGWCERYITDAPRLADDWNNSISSFRTLTQP